MSPFWQKIITDTVLRHKKKDLAGKTEYSPYEFAKAYYEFKITVVDFFRDLLFISLGILSATFGLKGFLLPNNFIDGGATGIALLISELSHFSLSILLIIVNIPFVILG